MSGQFRQRTVSLSLFMLALTVSIVIGSAAASDYPGVLSIGPPTTGRPVDVAFSQLESQIRQRWPDTFGGIWGSADADKGKIFVAFTRDAEKNVALISDEFPELDLLAPVTVPHSLADLEATQREMIADREDARHSVNRIEALDGVNYDLDVDRRRNVVVAIVPFTSDKQVAEIADDVDRTYGDAVVVEQGPLAHPQACSDRFHCGYQLRAGIGARFNRLGSGAEVLALMPLS